MGGGAAAAGGGFIVEFRVEVNLRAAWRLLGYIVVAWYT